MRIMVSFFSVILGLIPSLLIAQPKVEVVGGSRFSFGDVFTGKSVSRNVQIRNAGTESLTLSNVSAACGCTGTLLSDSKLAPSDTGTLSISFDSRRFTGQVEKSVTFNTNDPANELVRIIFSANVVKILQVEPEYIVLRTGTDSSTSEEVTLKNTGSEPLKVLTWIPSNDAVEVSVSPTTLNPGDEAKVTIALKSKNSGTFKGTVAITTDNPRVPTIDVRYFALVSGKKGTPVSSPDHN